MVTEDNNQRQLISTNIIDLCVTNRHLSDLLMTQLLHEDIAQKKKQFELDPVECLTAAEKTSEQVWLILEDIRGRLILIKSRRLTGILTKNRPILIFFFFFY